MPKQQFVKKSSTDSTSSLKRRRHDHNGCDADERQLHRNAETDFSLLFKSFFYNVFLPSTSEYTPQSKSRSVLVKQLSSEKRRQV